MSLDPISPSVRVSWGMQWTPRAARHMAIYPTKVPCVVVLCKQYGKYMAKKDLTLS